MDKLNKEYISILMQDKEASANFWELVKRVNKDRKQPGVILDMRRSTMIDNILMLLLDKVIFMDDLDEFSDVLKETMESFNKRGTFNR